MDRSDPRKPNQLLKRRSVVAGSVSAGLGGVLSQTGCTTFVQVVLPVLLATLIPDLYKLAKAWFIGRTFSGGDVLTDEAGIGTFVRRARSAVPEGFRVNAARYSFCTPVSVVQRGHERYLQLAVEGSPWSLISGGNANAEVYQLHEDWLSWLLRADNCNLRVSGNSTFRKCGIDGCPALVNAQDFLDVNGKVVHLFLSTEKSPKHAAHSESWKGCPAVEGAPEPCIFGGETGR